MKVFDELKARGLIAQTTHEDQIRELLNGDKPVSFYIGFDATADSLHVGHFLQITIMKRLQEAGHRPIALLGTGTTMIGDPSGKSDMRQMLTPEQINYNAECFRRQMERFIDFSEGKAKVVRNGDWLLKLNYIDFLREVGVHFSVNKMLSYDCFKSRWERGLTFIEFNYMPMQSYDFLVLYRQEQCVLQLGGDDQWSNILGGVDLIRRVESGEAFGMTFTLLTTKDGVKMGKTVGGAVWLDRDKTSPFDFFQYWRNVDDQDVINCLRWLTFLPLEQIAELEKLQGSELNKAKEILAYELTNMVHGKEDADKALEAAKALFVSGTDSDNMPTATLSDSDFTDGAINIIDALVTLGLTPSKGEARRLIDQGGITVDDEKIGSIKDEIKRSQFDKGHVIIRKGKKQYLKATLLS